MDVETLPGEPVGEPFDTLFAEATSALAYAAEQLRRITERYREALDEELGPGHEDRGAAGDAGRGPLAAQAGAELSRLEIAVRSIESSRLLLERGDATPASEPGLPDLPADLLVRIVEAQEAERGRLAQEVHDGPAQALSNAIFQADYIDRVLDEDPRVVRTELRFLRERLRRELGDVRAFISQLRPPLLDELGLDGSIADTVETLAALTGAEVETDLGAPAGRLGDAEQTVVLRVLQEALHNVRKHADARHVRVATRLEDGWWTLEVGDDGRGFEAATVAARGRRSFGLQFMRERAELVRARFEVHSRPAGGTVVTLQIPVGAEGGTG